MLTQYPDMYYALRGTADSFGIITTFYLQTKPAPQSVINFAVQIPSALDNVTIATDAFLKLQETVFNPSVVNSNLSFGIYTDNTGAFSLSGWCVQCDLGTFSNTTLPALLQGFPTPSSTSESSLGWIESLQDLAGSDPLKVPLTGFDHHDTFYAKSLVVKNAEPLTREELSSFWTFVIN
jgi:hypothetical protein